MRLAVTYENGMVFQHFGHTEQFKVYDIVDGKVAEAQVVGTDGNGHGALAGVLSALKVDTLWLRPGSGFMGVCPAARMKPWRLCWRVVSPIILMSAVEAMGIMEKDIPAEGRVPKGKTYWDNHKHDGEGSSVEPRP